MQSLLHSAAYSQGYCRLGGYTTFSSFSYETYSLLRDGKMWCAIVNVCIVRSRGRVGGSTVGAAILVGCTQEVEYEDFRERAAPSHLHRRV
jgi:fluoride ion exporter CrcB/FEX